MVITNIGKVTLSNIGFNIFTVNGYVTVVSTSACANLNSFESFFMVDLEANSSSI